jgi:hypothetical protein
MVTTHGYSKHPLYKTWRAMIERCENPKRKNWKYYGARGISVCERWRNSPSNFFQDMPPRPPGYSIDRIDNNTGYGPDNCRWANIETQNGNRRGCLFSEFNGIVLGVPAICKATGLSQTTVRKKIKQSKKIAGA